MENELVAKFKKEVNKLLEETLDYYDDVWKRCNDEERKLLSDDFEFLTDLSGDINSLNTTTKKNLKSSEELLQRYAMRFDEERKFIDNYLDERDANLKDVEVEEEDEEEVYEADVKPAKEGTKSKAGRVISGILAGILLAGTGVHTGIILHRLNNYEKSKEETIETTEAEQRNVGIPIERTNTEDTKEAEKTSETKEETKALVLGEYGTFTDVHDEEQIHARAQYLYDTYYSAIEGHIDDNRLAMMFGEHKNHITVEGIENVIRSMSGVPRVNESGEYYVTANQADQILNEAAFYLFGVPSAIYDDNNMKVYINIPSHLFVADNSEASRFLAGYDEAYTEFCRAYNKGDGEATYKAAQVIAEKMYYEWHLDGIFGDQNPYLLNPELLKIARMCSVDKWVNYVYEYEQDAQLAICVPVCVDYNTKELTELRGDEIQQAITYDLWEDTVAISAGMVDEVQQSKKDHGMKYENQVFVDYLMNEINYQYENNYKGKTVSDGKSLTLGK